MTKNRTIVLLIGISLLIPVLTHPQAANTVGKNFEALLQQILSNQQQMQADIRQLKEQIAEKDKEITGLRAILEKQETVLREQISREILEQSKTIEQQAQDSPNTSADSYASQVQYEKARKLMHQTIFEIRKGEQKSWFQTTLGEFQSVVDNYPHTPHAVEAQLRIARIYRRYLGDVEKAKTACRQLIKSYPDSKHVKEAQKILDELQTTK